MKEQNTNQKKKVFDDFKEVDCEECESWQLNQCDGVPVGSQRSCTAYKAVRRLNTPQEIKALQKGLERLRKAFWFMMGYMITMHIWMVIAR